jgi:hypothetical protein
MAHASHTSTAAGPQDMLQPAIDWSAQCVEGFQRAQKLQLEAFEVRSAERNRAACPGASHGGGERTVGRMDRPLAARPWTDSSDGDAFRVVADQG